MFFVRCPETDAAALTAQYDIGGYLLFARDFDGQTKESIENTIAAYQNAAKTPMLIGADEEGGTVVRVSSNPNLRGTKIPVTTGAVPRGRLLTASRATPPRRTRCCAI